MIFVSYALQSALESRPTNITAPWEEIDPWALNLIIFLYAII